MQMWPNSHSPMEVGGDRVSLPLYIAAFIASVAGLLSVGLTFLEDSTFVGLTILLTSIGFVVSYLSRLQNLSSGSIELPAALIFAGICILTFMNEQAPAFLGPAGGTDDRARAISVLLVWLVVIRSFTLTTDARLLFCCVPTIALVGLTSTMSTDPALVTYFVAFVASSVFLAIHENFLRSSVHARMASAGPNFLKAQIQAATACAAIAIVIANILSIPMQAVGSTIALNRAVLQNNRPTPDAPSGGSAVSVKEESEIRVARGPVRQTDQVLMRIQAEHEAYWRGATFDSYTGRSWRSTINKQMPLQPEEAGGAGFASPQGQTFRVPSQSINVVGPASHTLRQVVRLEGTGIFNEVYSASELRTVRIPLERVFMDESGSVSLPTPLQGTTYQVESSVPDSSPQTLRAVTDKAPDAITGRYLAWQTPTLKDGGQRLKTIAEEVTRGQTNTFDKVAALESWIGTQCKYNTDAGAAPEDADVVEHFLFTAKQGYCDSFATSLAILCRSLDIPARVASGFQPGELEPTTGNYVVRERDKHLWTEVFFAGVGWIPFDATSGAEDISPKDSKSDPWYKSIVTFLTRRGWLPVVALIVFVATAVYILKVEVLDRRRTRRIRGVPSTLPVHNLQVIDTYLQMRARLRKKGVPDSPTLTPLEYADEIGLHAELSTETAKQMYELTQLVIAARYSRHVCTPEDASRSKVLAKSVVAEARRSTVRSLQPAES